MTPEGRAWLAGFYEGEGSLSLRAGNYRHARIQIMQVEREPLDKCRDITGVGNVLGPYQYGKSKPHYVWNVSKHIDVWSIMDELYPLLSERRKGQVDSCRS